MSKSNQERLAEKQGEASVATKEKKVTVKAKKKVSLADLKKQAEAARSRLANIQAKVLEAENPELSALTARLRAATKEAASFPRFIALRQKGLKTKIQAVADQKKEIADLKRRQAGSDKVVAAIQAEIEAARLKVQSES